MKKSGICEIENTVSALQEAIENKKAQMQTMAMQPRPSGVVSHLFSEVVNRAGGSYGQINLALEHGGEFTRNFIKKLQQNVEDDPWDALRKVAVSSFGIGLWFSLRHKKQQTGVKE